MLKFIYKKLENAMAKLYEFQGKSILQKFGVAIPEGKAVENIKEAINVSNEIGFPVVVKIQTWSTGRAALGGVQFANSIDELKDLLKFLQNEGWKFQY